VMNVPETVRSILYPVANFTVFPPVRVDPGPREWRELEEWMITLDCGRRGVAEAWADYYRNALKNTSRQGKSAAKVLENKDALG
jgi:hypothetical protein